MVTSSAITGRCLCGEVRFTLSAPPRAAGYCHCTRCQRRTGSGASAQARVDGRALEITAGGAGPLRWWRHPDGGFEKGFCAACGSHLFSRDPDDHERINVRMAAFDVDPGIRPSFRAHVASAASWEAIPADGLPRHEGRRPS